MKKFEFKLNNGKTKTMELDEFVRWACLIEAMEKISDKLDEAEVPMDNTKWIKPLAIEKYIKERFHSMQHDIKVEVALGNI